MHIKNFLLSLVSKKGKNRIPTGELPASGRSSVETGTLNKGLNSIASFYNIVNPLFPVELLQYITLIYVANPDISQVGSTIRAMGNTGHNLVLTGDKTDKSIDIINEAAYTIYPNSGGVDGLINHYFDQLSISGALSSEDILNPNLDGVRRVAIVPPETIRFRYLDEEYKPFQQAGINLSGSSSLLLGMVELNPHTYSYFANQVINNSPYAIPPFLSALEPLIMQRDALKNIAFALKKLGILGLNTITPKRLQRLPKETDLEYAKRNQDYIDHIAKTVPETMANGILVKPEDWTWENKPLTTNLSGIRELMQIIEEQVYSGAKTYAFLAGRPYSQTETFATVLYNVLLANVSNYRRLIKRRQEKTYRLHLNLQGFFPDLSIQFKQDKRLDPNTEALASNYDVNAVIKKVKSGMISPAQGAQELGYDEWFDESLLKSTEAEGEMKLFRWDPYKQKYVLQRNLIDLDFIKRQVRVSHDDSDRRISEATEKRMKELVEKYLKATLPYFDKLLPDVVEFAFNYVKENIEKISQDATVLLEAVKQYVGDHPIYKQIKDESWFKTEIKKIILDAGKYFKLDDLTVFDGENPGFEFHFGEGDLKACDLLGKIDHYYFSKFLNNKDFGSQINKFITDLFSKGEVEFYLTDEAKKEFSRLFGSALQGDIEYQVQRIVNSCMARLRGYSYLSQMHDADFAYAEIIAVLDWACDLCRSMHGKRIPIKAAWNSIQEFINAPSLEAALEFIKNSTLTPDDINQAMDELIKSGKGVPPFHVLCKCILKAVFENR